MMPRRLQLTQLLAVFAAALGVAAAEPAQTGPEIIDQALERYLESLSKIENYTIVQDVMGDSATVHYEKRMSDGFPAFVPVSSFTLMKEWLDTHRMSISEAMILGGLQAVAPELAQAKYRQMHDFLDAAKEMAISNLGGGSDQPLESVRDVLVGSATRAGLRELSSRLDEAGAGQVATISRSLAGLGDGSILGQLGKIALGEAKKLAIEHLASAVGGPLGAAAAGVMTGRSGGGGLGALASAGGGAAGVGPQAIGTLAQAGMGALMGGLGALATRAMTPDLSQLDRSGDLMGPDVHAIMHRLRHDFHLAGSAEMSGADTWVLELKDAAAIDLPNAREFNPTGLTLHIDKQLHVLRRASIAGALESGGRRVPVAVDTRFENYRDVDGLLHPFRTVTLVRGVNATLTDAERKQLATLPDLDAEMRKKMEESLARMPPEQRAMVERMMQQQMQKMNQVRAIASAEPTEIVLEVREMRVNGGRPDDLQLPLPRSKRE